MNENFYLDTDALREKAHALIAQNEARERALLEIDAVLGDLKGVWNGDSSRVFLERYEDQRVILSELTDFFVSYARLLLRAADAIEEADRDMQKALAELA